MIKKLVLSLIIVFFCTNIVHCKVLTGNISLIDNVPQALYGSWEVFSYQTYSNNIFRVIPPGIDYWNLYRHNNVLTLENPQTNARASVFIDEVNNNTIKFTRYTKTTEEESIETPTITIDGENFWGTDKLVTKHFKNGILIRTDVVELSIRGKKLTGFSTNELLSFKKRENYE